MPINNPYIPGDPYSYDLKWIVDNVKTAVAEYTTLHGYYDQLISDFEDLENFVNDYFDNLDLTAEVTRIIEEMRIDGTLSRIIGSIIVSEDLISPIVADWLSTHIGPTTPAIDNTLTIPGAGADAYVTGLVRDTAEAAKASTDVSDELLGTVFTWSQTVVNMADNDNLIQGGVLSNGTISTAGAYSTYKTTPEITITTSGTYNMAVYQFSDTTPATLRHIWRIVHADTTTEWHNPDLQTVSQIALLAGDKIQLSADNPLIGFMFVEDPTSAIPFVPNGLSDIDFSMYGKSLIRSIVGVQDVNVTLTKYNNSITVAAGDFSSTMYLTRTGFANETFNFVNTSLDGYGVIKASTDDITPLRLYQTGIVGQSTVGANHGWNCFTLSAATVTTADVGSRWTDGTNSYTLMKVDGGLAYFFYYTNATTFPAPSGNLTSIDAVHQTPLDVSSYATTQFWPSINNRTVKIINSSEEEITTNGVYDDYQFTIREQYNVIDYIGAQTYLNAHIGSSVSDPDVPALFTSITNYIFSGTACFVDTVYKFYDTCVLADCGVLQATFLANANGTGYGILDNANGLIDFGNPSGTELWIPRGSDVIATPGDVVDPDLPISNFNQFVVDGNGDTLYGFVFGYFPDKTEGAIDKRLGNGQYWNIATFNKSYPTVYYNKQISAGDVLETAGYRLYYKGNDVKSFSFGRDLYVFVAKTSSETGTVDLPDYVGYKVEMLTGVNTKLNSDIIGAAGLSYTITGGGNALFKISK